MKDFLHLFQPFSFRNFQVSNRIVLPPMAIYVPGSRGYVTQRLLDYYEERAQNGPGYIIVNATVVSAPSGSSHPNQTAITHDKYIEGLQKLVDVIGAHGAKTSLQLYHCGRQRYGMIAGGETLSPSGIPDPVRKDPTRAMTREEIKKLVKEYAAAALRAKAAGFDGIELHCAHGYLLSGFLSPFQNRRTDEYGGDLLGRTLIVREILASCRRAVGEEMLLQVRLNGSDYVNGGNGLEDAKEIAKILVGEGAEVIHVSAGMAPSGQYSFLPASIPQGHNLYLAEGIKEAVGKDTPVIASGALEDPVFAEEVLRGGVVDLVALGRPLFADPDLIEKTRQGSLEEIRPCLRCFKSAATWPEDMRCVVNPAVGREKEFKERIQPTSAPKDILVIGAGPAGLEAARVAAIRGHRVLLMEKDEKIGGKIHLAMTSPEKERLLTRWLDYYRHQLEKLEVAVRLKTVVTEKMVAELDPQIILVATGGLPLLPKGIMGLHLPGVVTADSVLSGEEEVGKQVAIIGGSSLGVETGAVILEDADKEVLVIEMEHELLLDISHDAALALLEKLTLKNFTSLVSTQVEGVEEERGKRNLWIRRYDQKKQLKGFDTVVLACGVVPNHSLGLQLKEEREGVYFLGDCEEPGDFRKAIHDAAEVVLEL